MRQVAFQLVAVFTLFASAARAETCPERAEKALISIPARPLIQTNFALVLTNACEKALSVEEKVFEEAKAKIGGAAPLSLSSPSESFLAVGRNVSEQQLAQAALAVEKLKRACVNLAPGLGVPALTEEDIDVLWAAFQNPAALLALEQIVQRDADALSRLFVQRAAGTLSGPVPGLPDPLGALQSTVINGLTNFIVDRAKAEGQRYLAERLKESICGDSSRPFFRNTCIAFEGLDVRLQFAAMGAFLQAAASRDLQRMPELVVGSAACESPSDAGELAVLRVALAFYREAARGRNPLELSRSLHQVKLDCEEGGGGDCRKVVGVIRAASQLSEAVQSQYEYETLKSVPAGDRRWGAYAIGALFSFAQLRNNRPVLLNIRDRYGAAVALLHETQRIAERIQAIRGDTEGVFSSADRAAVVAEVLTASVDVVSTLTDRLPGLDQATAKKVSNARALTAIGERMLAPSSPGEMAVAFVELRQQVAIIAPEFSSKIPKGVDRALPIIVELANADSSDQVAQTLDAAAAPVGSYRGKFDAPSVSLNAFLGGAFGAEHVSGVDRGFGSAVGSVFAPVGIHATVPFLPSALSNYVHVGGMVSIIDVGAIASTRLNAETGGRIAEEQQVSFLQVLSPGAYLTVGALRAPLVLGAGLSIVPEGRTAEVLQEDGTTAAVALPVVRAMGFLAVDLTLFSF